MSKYSCYFLASVAIVLLLAGCAGTSEIKARLGQEFSLSVGQTALIAGENLKIRFEEVAGDSRCPRNVTCVWEGKVDCTVVITENALSHQISLVQPGLTDQYSIATYQDYQLTFRVEPYPEEGKQIPANDYRLLLTISK